MDKIELNDDCKINVKLANVNWNVVLDWLAHTPYTEGRQILTDLNEQIKKIDKNSQEKEFTASLMIRQFNTLIFGLGQAPYYLVADIVQSIYAQGQAEIQRLREENIQAAVEKSELSPDNTNTNTEVEQPKKKPTRRTKAKKAEPAAE